MKLAANNGTRSFLKRLCFIPCLIVVSSLADDPKASGANVLEFMDLQGHATMHYAYGFFGDSFEYGTSSQIEKLTSKHLLKNVVYANLLARNPGVRIFINGAIAPESETKRENVAAALIEQIDAVNRFAANHSDDFVVAKTPEEVRIAIGTTKKTVIVHSIEGARNVVLSAADARFWARQGVSFITLIHLLDDEYGGAALNPVPFGKIINFRGTLKKIHNGKIDRGLTEQGRNAVKWLAEAGIVTDLTHMSPKAVDDAIAVYKKLSLPPLMTHALFEPIQRVERGATRKQVLEIYRLGGLISIPINGRVLVPVKPEDDFLRFIQGRKICEGSLDSYRASYDYLGDFLKKNAAEILGHEVHENWDELSSDEKVILSVGWASDFNGFTDHSRPRYGRDGCWKLPENATTSNLETKGLAHPGLLPEYWKTLADEGLNTQSLKNAAEKFLRIWEKFRSYSQSHSN